MVEIVDFVPNLQIRSKWFNKRENLAIGDIVLVRDHIPRGKWKLGIVKNVIPGTHGYVRNAEIKTREGIHNRPISTLTHFAIAKGRNK